MEQSLSDSQLAVYTTGQLNTFFSDPNPVSESHLASLLPRVLERLEVCFSGLVGRYFRRDGVLWFDHLNADQYAMYVYLLSNEAFRSGESGRDVAVKSYLLNKALYGIEAYYEVELPAVFWFSHAVGSVLGRANYGNGIVISQGCTVGNKDGVYPTFGEKVVLCANSVILGNTRLGSEVCVGAGSQLIDETIPDGTTVVGSTPRVRVLQKRSRLVEVNFTETLPRA